MARLYFGKFSKQYPEQIEELFYAAGPEGNEWYGGIKPGDYVFPIYQGKVEALWVVREYGKKENRINKEDQGVVFFDKVRDYKIPLRLAEEFIRYRYFELDLNLLNKSAKSVKNCGFHRISCSLHCPSPEAIEFVNNLRNIYIAYSNSKLHLKEGDILIAIDPNNKTIDGIFKHEQGKLETYEVLETLYREKSPEGYSLSDLFGYAKLDKATQKEKYLQSVLMDLGQKGYYEVQNPIQLYDNILVGRKKTISKFTEVENVKDHINTPEDNDMDNAEELAEYESLAELLLFNPNLILYGPPGTGKTYATRKIVEVFDKLQTGVKSSFSAIEKEGRAKFITFHQSYSYEEFIEGIRPEVMEDDTEESGGEVKYRVTDGILKQMAKEASMQVIKSMKIAKETDLVQRSSRIWKVSLGARFKEEHIYAECIKNKEIAIGWLEDRSLEGLDRDTIYKLLKKARGGEAPNPTNDASSINDFINEMSIGDIVLIYASPKTIRDIGVVKTNYYYKEGETYPHRRGVAWLKHFEDPLNIYEYNGRVNLMMRTIYELDRIDFTDLLKMLELDREEAVKKFESKPYYLIIDEINRGNISKIFGELITLIEKDKRGTYYCTLPYSKKSFTLPDNLYIIGTMNTADKSIALLDTALRRRFSFVEIEPSLKVFDNPNFVGKINQINLGALLQQLNQKIEVKLDRDHRIGHSYFLDIDNLKNLYHVWYYKIIPLLMEYFYGDVNAVQEIIGKDFFGEDGQIKHFDLRRETEAANFEAGLLKLCAEGS